MDARVRRSVMISLLTFGALSLMAGVGYMIYTEAPGDHGLALRLAECLRSGRDSIVDFDELATFDFTEVHFISAYSTADSIQEDLGRPYRYRLPNLNTDENSLLVFVNDGEIVATTF